MRLAIGAFAAAIIAATSAFTLPAANTSPQLRQRSEQARPTWTPEQVAELIGAIGEVRAHGLDPNDYGLAALRSERELCARLWGVSGSTQLDALAQSAALALASDYRRSAGGAEVEPSRHAAFAAELDAARRSGRLRTWLASQATS